MKTHRRTIDLHTCSYVAHMIFCTLKVFFLLLHRFILFYALFILLFAFQSAATT